MDGGSCFTTMESQNDVKHRRTSRRLKAMGCDQILSAVAKYHEVDPREYVGYRDPRHSPKCMTSRFVNRAFTFP